MGTLGSTETSAPSGSTGATLGQHPMDRSTPAVSKATHPPLQTEAKGQTSIHQAFSTSSVPYNSQAVGEILNSSSPTRKKPRTREISWFCRSSSTMCRDHHGQGSTHTAQWMTMCVTCVPLLNRMTQKRNLRATGSLDLNTSYKSAGDRGAHRMTQNWVLGGGALYRTANLTSLCLCTQIFFTKFMSKGRKHISELFPKPS